MSLKTLGRYEIVKPLGQGAMGVVYEAHDPNIKRAVAIKTIRVDQLSSAMAAEFEARFRCETQAGGRLQHPNIIGVYDAGRDQGLAFMVMELVRGGDLRQQLVPGQPQPFERSMTLMKELLSALHFAHEQGIIHRDIKPANLMLDLNGRVKLGDFGVAQIADVDVDVDAGQAPAADSSTVGTLKYLSPEQVNGESVDARADLFAAGVVLYQLLTGAKPFEGDSDFAVMQAIVQRTPTRPTLRNLALPPGIDAVVLKALSKHRDDRFAAAKDFALALRSVTQQAAGGVPSRLPLRRSRPELSAVAKDGYDDEATRLARPVVQAARGAEQVDQDRRAAQAARAAEIARKAEELRRAQAQVRRAELAERARVEAQEAAALEVQAQAKAKARAEAHQAQQAEQAALALVAEFAARDRAAAAAAIEVARAAASVVPLPVIFAPSTERGNGRLSALSATLTTLTTLVLLGGGTWFANRDTATPAARPPVAVPARSTTPTVAGPVPVPVRLPDPIPVSVSLLPTRLTTAAPSPASAPSSRRIVPPAPTQAGTAAAALPAPPRTAPPGTVTQPAPVVPRPALTTDSAAVAAPAPAAPISASAPAPAPAPEPFIAVAKPGPAELFDRGQKLEATSLRQAEAAYRDAAQQGHGASQKRLWELLLKAGRETEAIRYQKDAWDQKVPGVPEPRSAIRL